MNVELELYNNLRNQLNDLREKKADLTNQISNSRIDYVTAKSNVRNTQTKDMKEKITRKTLKWDLFVKKWNGYVGWAFDGKKPLSHYIALVIIIILIIVGVILITAFIIVNVKVYKETKGFLGKITAPFRTMFNKIFGYKTRSRILSLTGNLPKNDGIDRENTGGRCDNMKWLENGKFCVSTSKPKDITWTIDEDKLTDIKDIPYKLKEKMTRNGNKLVINIPYEKIGLDYIPNCSNMTYFDNTKVGKGELLRQEHKKDKYCSLVEKTSTTYIKS
jgi:hypothetical protein